MISIAQNPQTLTPAYNEQWFVIASDNYTQSNFKFVIDIVLLGDVTYTYRIKRNIYPGSTNQCVFDAHRLIEDYITHDIDLGTMDIELNPNSWKGYILRFGEEYGSTPVVYPNLLESDIILTWNAAMDFVDFKTYNAINYKLGYSTSKFLTTAPASVNCTLDDFGWLYAIQDPAGSSFDTLKIETFDVGGNTIQVAEVANPYASLSSSGDCFLRMPSYPASLNLIPTLSSGTQPIVDSSVAYYNVRAYRSGVLASVAKTYVLKESCSPHERRRVYWLNPYGGFDGFTFSLASEFNYDIRKESYTKPKGTLSGGAFGYDISDRFNTVYYAEEKTKLKITSDWLTDEESDWLKSLLSSPVVFLEYNGVLIAVNIEEKEYVAKKTLTNTTFQLQLTLSTTYVNQLQRY